ncbi:MAG: LL-diaminopimelate aminotransferase [Cyanobacteria bacterium P01_H01_bin.15]
MQLADRIQPLQKNVFADMDRAKGEAIAAGQSLIDLSLGSSDLPVAEPIINAIANALPDAKTHGYLLFNGTQDFRQAVASWYKSRYGVAVNPETEVLPLIGSQEGTAHLPLAVLNPGEIALLLDPGYPSHSGGVHLAGGEIYPLPLLAEHDFLPQLEKIPDKILSRSRLLVLSYPHNPTSAIAPLSFFKQAVVFAQRHNLVLAHDFPYADFAFDPGTLLPSILQADPDKSVSIEFFTFSKSYNMGGFRIGFAIGNSELIGALRRIKAVVDFNQYRGILSGAIAALQSPPALVQKTVDIFCERRDRFVSAMHSIGWTVPTPAATMYVWAKLPPGWEQDSIKFAVQLVKATGVAVSPGAGFGPAGEGYVRFALVHDPDVLEKAVQRINSWLTTQQ